MAKDVDLFKAAMAGARPIKGRKVSRPAPALTSPQSGAEEKKATAPVSSPVTRGRLKEAVGNIAEAAFDRDIDRALSRGRRSPEAKLDLHGMTLAAAERAVAQFLAQSRAQARPSLPTSPATA